MKTIIDHGLHKVTEAAKDRETEGDHTNDTECHYASSGIEDWRQRFRDLKIYKMKGYAKVAMKWN